MPQAVHLITKVLHSIFTFHIHISDSSLLLFVLSCFREERQDWECSWFRPEVHRGGSWRKAWHPRSGQAVVDQADQDHRAGREAVWHTEEWTAKVGICFIGLEFTYQGLMNLFSELMFFRNKDFSLYEFSKDGEFIKHTDAISDHEEMKEVKMIFLNLYSWKKMGNHRLSRPSPVTSSS